MLRTTILIIGFSISLVNPAFGQSYASGWKYQMELLQGPEGTIKITYSKTALPEASSSADKTTQDTEPSPSFKIYGPVNAKNWHHLPPMNNDGRLNVVNLLMSGENQQNRSYQMTLSYFMFLNNNIPPVITLPASTNNNRFPDVYRNEYYPMPEGN